MTNPMTNETREKLREIYRLLSTGEFFQAYKGLRALLEAEEESGADVFSKACLHYRAGSSASGVCGNCGKPSWWHSGASEPEPEEGEPDWALDGIESNRRRIRELESLNLEERIEALEESVRDIDDESDAIRALEKRVDELGPKHEVYPFGTVRDLVTPEPGLEEEDTDVEYVFAPTEWDDEPRQRGAKWERVVTNALAEQRERIEALEERVREEDDLRYPLWREVRRIIEALHHADILQSPHLEPPLDRGKGSRGARVPDRAHHRHRGTAWIYVISVLRKQKQRLFRQEAEE